MIVEREDLERHLEAIKKEVRDPRLGLYGPKTASWRIGREAALFLGGGRAALLQLAHPFVAHAIEQHSRTKIDLAGRFQRTFTYVYSMIFGDIGHAIRSARRVHAFHQTVRGEITEDVGPFRHGTPYQANDEDALLWVHATLVDTALRVYDLCVRPLTVREKEEYWLESHRFARLFGISDRVLPKSWDDFCAYFDGMLASSVITAGRPAREMAHFLLQPPRPVLAPAMQAYRIVTAGLLPPRLRREFGLPFGLPEKVAYKALIASARPAYRVLPRRLRYVPAYVEARGRLIDKTGPDRFGRTIERYALRWLAPKPKPAG